MPASARRLVARAVAVVALLATLVGVGACGLLPALPVAEGGELVTYEAHGGMCPEGECRFSARIFGDGRVTRSDGVPQVVDPMSLELLVRAIAAADWDAILAVPFEGECPVNFDGTEEVYTFHVAPEPVVIASCTTHVDPAQDPFRTVQGILFGTGG